MTEATRTNTQTRDSHESNRFSPRATGGSVSISGSTIVNVILAVAALIAVAVSFQADQRSERAADTARLMERETRLMKDDLKYIRAYLSARGIHVPADHDEAEEKLSGSQNNHLVRPQSATGRVPDGGARIVTGL